MGNAPDLTELRAILKPVDDAGEPEAPTEYTFNALAHKLGNGDVSEDILTFVEGYLSTWPTNIKRTAPYEWVSRTCRGWKAPALRLANCIEIRRKTFGAKNMIKLAASPNVANITRLENDPSTKTDIGDEGCIALAESSHFSNLTRLQLWDTNTVSEIGALALVNSPNMEGIEHLMMRFSRANTNTVAEAFINSTRFSSLRHLDLTFNCIDKAHCERMKAAPALSSVKTFWLGG